MRSYTTSWDTIAAADPWTVREEDYPAEGSVGDRLAFLLRYAVLAPSSHNTQPWLFRPGDAHIDLLADRTRCLPVVDPHDRALEISCGAALGMLRLAMRRFGHAGEVVTAPAGHAPDWLARISLGDARPPTAQDIALCQAIPARRTVRKTFERRPLPAELVEMLRRAAAEEGCVLTVITESSRREMLAALIAEGDRIQFADASFRRELAGWMHSRRSASRDGLSVASFGLPDLLTPVQAALVRAFDLGGGIAASDLRIAEGSPALAVLSTPADVRADWLAAGQALSRVLVAAAAAGVAASFLNQPIEVERLRPRVRELAGGGVPQMLLRLGFGPAVPAAARRPLSEVLLP